MKIDTQIGQVGIKIDTSRLDRNILEAQRKLDTTVLNDMLPYVPSRSGFLRGSGQISPCGGEIVFGAVYSHYIYVGELYLAANGSSWAKKYEQKFPTGKPLDLSSTPGAEKEFFEAAKRDHLTEWEEVVKKEIGKG